MKYSRTILKPAEITDIYWQKKGENMFTLRYCIMVDGQAIPQYDNFSSYEEALQGVKRARLLQGFTFGGDV